MTCADARAKLLQAGDPQRPPADVRGHLAGCPDCVAFQAAAARVDAVAAGLPVPPADPARKAELLARLAAAGGPPIIARVPVVPPRRGLADLIAHRRAPQAVAGLAAGLLAAVGGWRLATGPGRPPPAPPPLARHDLLQKEVRFVVALAHARGPEDRLSAWAGVAADLQAEAAGVYLATTAADDLDALAGLFDTAVTDGVAAQARLLSPALPADRRRQALGGAAEVLAAAERSARDKAADAQPHARPAFRRMAAAAATGRQVLARLAAGDEA